MFKNKTLLLNTFRRKLSSIDLPPCNFKPKKYDGVSYEKMTKIRKDFLTPALVTHFSEPLAFHQGYKQWLFDLDGKRYLDMYGGICTVSVGHCHPKITEALTNQISTLGHVSTLYYNTKVHEYAERLAEKFSGDLKVVYFVNSGSEANDLAVLMARAYTDNLDILTLRNCYHGMSYQTMALTSVGHYKYPVPQAPGVHNVLSPDVYNGPWGGSHCRDSPIQTDRTCSCKPLECQAKDNYIKEFKSVFNKLIPKRKLAAFFAESVQGVAGVVQYPKDFLKEAYEVVKANNGLFVADEVQAGFGRTGEHFWGFEMHGITPDIVTLAKGIGNGFPLGAVVTTPEVSNGLMRALHFNTFGGNPLASAVGISVLDIIEEEKLQQNSLEVGTHLLKKLAELKKVSPFVGDVRGKGLMIGVELVADKENRIPLDKKRFMKFWDNCKENSLILGKGGYNGNIIRIKPPMCVTKEDADFTVKVIEQALSEIC